MRQDDGTSIGGARSAFQSTHWTELIKARTANDGRRQAAAERLVRVYWKPVYCYLRRKGKTNEDAKDLTQGFFSEVVLGRGLLPQADPGKGSFRAFLLTALRRYAASAHRASTARKRSPPNEPIRLDAMEPLDIPEFATAMTPDQTFTYAWASALLDEVLAEVKDGCCCSGLEIHWQLFHARVVRPAMDDAKPPSLTKLCARFGLDSVVKASNMIVTVNRRFKKTLRDRVRQWVDSEDQVDDEIRELMAIFASSAGA